MPEQKNPTQPNVSAIPMQAYFTCAVSNGTHKLKFAQMVEDENKSQKSLTVCELCGISFINEVVRLKYATATPAPQAPAVPEREGVVEPPAKPLSTMPNETPAESQAVASEPTTDGAAPVAPEPTPAPSEPAAQ